MIILLSLTACVQKDDIGYYTAEDFGMSEINSLDSGLSSEMITSEIASSSIESEEVSSEAESKLSTSSQKPNESSSSKQHITVSQTEDKVVYYEKPSFEKPKMLKKPEYKPAEISGEVLDSGKCGDELYWELYSNGTLHIHGSGRMYDYIKMDPERQSPWYKYRAEPHISDDGTYFLNPDGTKYVSVDSYKKNNPNGWKIKNVRIDPGVTYIGNWAFYRICVEHLEIPEGVTETGYFAIRFSPTLKTVSLPDSLILLDDLGISRNQVLETIYFGNSLKTLGIAALNDNDMLKSVILPDSVTEINKRQHKTHDAHENQSDNVGFLESCDKLETAYLGNVKYIPQRTFLNCTALETIIIPKSVEYIEEYAFFSCEKLKTVVFEEGSSCKLIETKAFFNTLAIEYFYGCTSLETIEQNAFVHGGLKSLKIFEFSDSNISFQNGMFAGSQLVTANIGSKMNKLSDYMFSNSKLNEIYISSNITEFGNRSLSECSQLKHIYFNGTKADWVKIQKTSNYAYMTPDKNNSATVHFSDGTTEKLKNILK